MGYYLITILWVALDQWTKKWTVTNMTIGQTIPLIENVFHLTYSNNYGAAFSILQNKQTFLILFTGIMMIAMIVYMFSQRKKVGAWVMVSLALIVGGGIGNLIDRVVNGYVVDMLDFRLWNPIFNVADVGVTCGCVLLVLAVFFSEPAFRKKTKQIRRTKREEDERKTGAKTAGEDRQ
jgi:signal peptidase II